MFRRNYDSIDPVNREQKNSRGVFVAPAEVLFEVIGGSGRDVRHQHFLELVDLVLDRQFAFF